MRREYQGGAQPAQLVEPLGGSPTDLTIECDDLTGWPTGSIGPFYVVIDRGKVSEEKILCVTRTGNILAVWTSGATTGRGADGTSRTAHNANAVIEHVFTATDANEANLHVNSPALHVTAATTATLPSPPVADQVVLATDSKALLGYVGGLWVDLTGAQGGGTNRVFWENDVTVTQDYSLSAGRNAGTFGPVTIESGVTVTVPSGSVWTVV